MKWTILGIVEAVISVVLLVWLLAVFFGGAPSRRLADSYDTFEAKLREGDRSAAAKSANDVAGRIRNGQAFRLEAAALKYAAGDVKGAVAVAKKIAADPEYPKRERAQAKLILAAAAVAKDEPALAAAEKYASEAVELDADLGDAGASLGTVLARQGKREEAVKALTKGISAPTPPSAEMLAQAYLARGQCLLMGGEAGRSMDDFLRAIAIRPKWKKAKALLFTARLSTVCQPKVSKEKRNAVIMALQSDPASKKELAKPTALLAFGVAKYYSGLPREAADKFRAATRHPETAGVATANLAVLMRPEITGLLGKVEKKRKLLAAEAKKVSSGATNPWKTVVPGKELVLRSAVGELLGPRDVRMLVKPRANFEKLLADSLATGALPPELAAKVTRAQAILEVWKYLHAPSKKAAEAALGKAVAALKPIADGGTDAWATRSYGALLLKAGRTVEAVKVLRAAARMAPDDLELAGFIKALAAKPTFSDFTPSTGSSIYLRPLVGLTIQVNAGPAQAADGTVTMELDGQRVAPEVIGSNVAYLPKEPLKDGRHIVGVSFVDPYGNQAEQSYTFFIDNAPPVVKRLTPGQNEAVAGPRPTFVLECADEGSGVDPTSVNVVMYPIQTKGPSFRDLIIKDGVYQFHSFSEPKFRGGETVGQGKIVFTSKRDLTVGTYRIEFDFADNRDIHVKQKNWIFRID